MSTDSSSRGILDHANPPWQTALRLTVVVALLASAGTGLWVTRHWPVVGDAPLMHYAVFLIAHGHAPYRDLVDVNLPGTYALEAAAMRWLGPGAAGWRAFDFLLLGVCGAAMVAITWAEDWLAGFFAASLFALIHLRDGPANTGQRDLMMTAFLLAACALILAAIRRRSLRLAACFGLCVGAAACIKPTGALFAIAFAAWMLVQRSLRSSQTGHPPPCHPPSGTCHPEQSGGSAVGPLLHESSSAIRHFLATATAFLLPIAAMFLWLARWHSLRAFLGPARELMAYHAAIGRSSFPTLLVGSFPSVLLAVTIPAAIVAATLRPSVSTGRQHRELAVLTIAALLGMASYIAQGKGFPYHRYPAEAFLLLLSGLILTRGLRAPRTSTRAIAVSGLLLGALYLAPASAAIAAHFDWRNQEFNQLLAADLTHLTGPAGIHALDNRVQCIDMTAGCLNTLYNLELPQSTGYLVDCYLFQPEPSPARDAYREGFARALEATRPQVLVVTDQRCFSLTRTWSQLELWPQFDALLTAHYRLLVQRTPPHPVGWWRKPSVPYSYRIYVRVD